MPGLPAIQDDHALAAQPSRSAWVAPRVAPRCHEWQGIHEAVCAIFDSLSAVQFGTSQHQVIFRDISTTPASEDARIQPIYASWDSEKNDSDTVVTRNLRSLAALAQPRSFQAAESCMWMILRDILSFASTPTSMSSTSPIFADGHADVPSSHITSYLIPFADTAARNPNPDCRMLLLRETFLHMTPLDWENVLNTEVVPTPVARMLSDMCWFFDGENQRRAERLEEDSEVALLERALAKAEAMYQLNELQILLYEASMELKSEENMSSDFSTEVFTPSDILSEGLSLRVVGASDSSGNESYDDQNEVWVPEALQDYIDDFAPTEEETSSDVERYSTSDEGGDEGDEGDEEDESYDEETDEDEEYEDDDDNDDVEEDYLDNAAEHEYDEEVLPEPGTVDGILPYSGEVNTTTEAAGDAEDTRLHELRMDFDISADDDDVDFSSSLNDAIALINNFLTTT